MKIKSETDFLDVIERKDMSSYVEKLFSNPDDFKEKLTVRFLPKNSDKIDKVYTKNFLDLKVAFCINVVVKNNENGEEKLASIFVPNDKKVVEKLGVEFVEVKNLPNFVCVTKPLYEVINVPKEMHDLVPIYLMTNKEIWYGASSILNTQALIDLSNKVDDDLIIYPSSVHEVLIQRYSDVKNDIAYASEMVKNINAEIVGDDNLLSNSIYHFSRGSQKLSII